MNELFFLLIESMKEETVCYRRLALLARDQKELLIAGGLKGLAENTRLQEKQVFALTPIKGRREETLAKMAKEFHLKKMDLNGALKKAPADVVEDFKNTLTHLIQAAKELASVASVSGKLLDNAVKFSNFTIKAIREGGKKKSFSMSVAAEDKRSFTVNRVV
jgi:hypothetical protein